MAYTFFKAQGGSIGKSLCEEDKLDLAKSLIEKARTKGVNLLLPADSVAADDFSNDANTEVVDNMNIKDGYMGLDIGPKARVAFEEVIRNSRTILWNGPMGVFELSNFAKGTIEIAKAIAASTANGAFSLVGGGDSVAAVNKYNLKDQVSYVSTGGGAMLEFIEGKELPGVVAIEG
jgi:phosphoglycerate kinase